MRLSGKCVAFCAIDIIGVFNIEVYSEKSAAT